MKKGIFIAAIALLAGEAFAQKAELTSAILSYRKQDMATAKMYIDKAEAKLNDGGSLKDKDLGKFYHHRGLICYSIYNDTKDVALLNTATEAFKVDSEGGSSYSKKSSDELLRCTIAYNEIAYIKYEEKDFAGALIMFEKLVEINAYPSIGIVDTTNLFNASLMAIQASDSEKAVELLNKLIVLDPTKGDYHLSVIKEYGKLANKEGKFAAIKAARLAVPNHTGLIFEEVNYYLAENNTDELLRSLDEAILAAPDNAILYFAKGSTNADIKNVAAAKEAYMKAIEIDADYFDAYNNLAGLFLDQTVRVIEKMNNLGLSAADQKKYSSLKKKRNSLYKEAKPYLEEAVRINGMDINVLKALKEVCYQTDDIDCWKRINAQIKELSK
jgi:tetratricopeptide (TPR) repeat protein